MNDESKNDNSNIQTGASGPSALAQRLLAWRRANGFTQAQVAKQLGCGVATIKNWERGRRAPRGLAAEAVARLLQASKMMPEVVAALIEKGARQ